MSWTEGLTGVIPLAGSSAGQAEHQLVLVAPRPVLAGFDRADDRMAGLVAMRGRVPVDAVVAAPDLAAGLAHPQVHPAVAERHALRAAGHLFLRLEVADLVEVLAGHADRSPEATRRCERAVSGGE